MLKSGTNMTVGYRETRDGIAVSRITIGAGTDSEVSVYPDASFLTLEEWMRLHDLGADLQNLNERRTV